MYLYIHERIEAGLSRARARSCTGIKTSVLYNEAVSAIGQWLCRDPWVLGGGGTYRTAVVVVVVEEQKRDVAVAVYRERKKHTYILCISIHIL